MRERYVLTRRGLIARSALLGGRLLAVPSTVAGRRPRQPRAVSRHPTAPRSATSRATGPSSGAVPTARPGCWSSSLDERELRPELDRAGAGSARGHGLHGQARPAGPAPGQRVFYRVRFLDLGDLRTERARHRGSLRPRPVAGVPCGSSGRPTRWDRAGASTRTSAACGSTRPCARSSRSSSSIRATRSTPTGRSTPRRATRTAAPGSGRTASPGATWSSRRSRRWRRACASSAWPMPTTCWTRTCGASMRKSPCSRSGTTMRSSTTGTGKSCSAATSAIPRSGSRCWRHGRAAPSTTTCRYGRTRSSGTGSTAASVGAFARGLPGSTCAPIRAANGDNLQPQQGPETRFLGRDQIRWLKQALLASDATWKVIAADMPIGVLVFDNFVERRGSEAVAQGNGPALGRELEIAELLTFIHRNGIRNTVWLTADLHYSSTPLRPQPGAVPGLRPVLGVRERPAQCRHVRPQRARRHVRARDGVREGARGGTGEPAAQCRHAFFGQVDIDGTSEVMTVRLKDIAGATLFTQELVPEV